MCQDQLVTRNAHAQAEHLHPTWEVCVAATSPLYPEKYGKLDSEYDEELPRGTFEDQLALARSVVALM